MEFEMKLIPRKNSNILEMLGEVLSEREYTETIDGWTFVEPDASTADEGIVSVIDSFSMTSVSETKGLPLLPWMRFKIAINKAKFHNWMNPGKELTTPIRV